MDSNKDLNRMAIVAKNDNFILNRVIVKIRPLLKSLSCKYDIKGYEPEDLENEFVEKIILSIDKYKGTGSFVNFATLICSRYALDVIKSSNAKKNTGKENISLDEFLTLLDSGEVNFKNMNKISFDPRESICARIDFERKIEQIKKLLNEELCEIVDMLVDKLTLPEISKELDLATSSVQRKIEKIRKVSEPVIKRDEPKFRKSDTTKIRKRK
jgi:RNA polymerase sigma factor (sigma-70 family)